MRGGTSVVCPAEDLGGEALEAGARVLHDTLGAGTLLAQKADGELHVAFAGGEAGAHNVPGPAAGATTAWVRLWGLARFPALSVCSFRTPQRVTKQPRSLGAH